MEEHIYKHHYSITAADMDTHYRMTASAVLLYYQDCWARYMAKMHLAAFDMVHRNMMWVISEFNSWWEAKEAYWSQEVEVEVWNAELTGLRLYADFRMLKHDGHVIAHGYGCWTLLDIGSHRPVSIGDAIGAEALQLKGEEKHKKRAIPAGTEVMHRIEHRVNPINLDFNGHMNNRTYLSIAMQTVSEERMGNRKLASLTIRWLRETFLGDTLQCRLLATDVANGYLHVISKDEMPVAQIYTELEERCEQTIIDEEASRA